MLTKDDILAQEDLKVEPLDVPEWGGSVYLRVMRGSERDAFEASIRDRKGNPNQRVLENIRARFAAIVLCDESGKRLFVTEAEYALLGRKSAAALDRVWDAGRKLNGMEAVDIEDAEKNSEATESEETGSD